MRQTAAANVAMPWSSAEEAMDMLGGFDKMEVFFELQCPGSRDEDWVATGPWP